MFDLGMTTRLIPDFAAASILADTPPMGRTSPRTVRDPVIARFWSIGTPSKALMIAVAMVMDAPSPSTL